MTKREAAPPIAEIPFELKGGMYVPGTGNNIITQQASPVININGATGGREGTARDTGVRVPIEADGVEETVVQPTRRKKSESTPDVDALRQQITEQLQGQFDEQLNQKLTELRAEVGTQLGEKDARITALEERVTELEAENTRLQEEKATLEQQNQELQARIAELEGGAAGGNTDNNPPTGTTPEQITEMEGNLEGARNELIRLTILRKGRMTDRFGRRRREDREAYDQALDNYNQLFEGVLNRRRELLMANGANEQDVRQGLIEDVYGERANFAQGEVDTNNQMLDDEVARGGWRRLRANVLRRWANMSTRNKILIGLGVGIGAGVVSGGLGLGLFGLAAGSATKFSLGLLNRRASLRNVSQRSLERQLAGIEQAQSQALANLGNADLGAHTNELVGGTASEYRANVARAQRRNKVGNALWIGSTVFAGLGIAHMAGADVIPDKGWLSPFTDHGHNNSTSGSGHSGNGSGGEAANGNQPGSGQGNIGENGTGTGTNGNGQTPAATGSGNQAPGTGSEAQPGGGNQTPGTQPGGETNPSNPTSGDGWHRQEWPHAPGDPSEHAVAVDLPDGMHLELNAAGKVNMVDAQGQILVENVGTTKTGALAPWVVERLQENGFTSKTSHHLVYDDTTGPGRHGWTTHSVSYIEQTPTGSSGASAVTPDAVTPPVPGTGATTTTVSPSVITPDGVTPSAPGNGNNLTTLLPEYEHTGITTPEGMIFHQNIPEGSYSLTTDDGRTFPVGWNRQGDLDQDTLERLRAAGFQMVQDRIRYKGDDGLDHIRHLTRIIKKAA